jgi:hypothetical protein
VARWVTALLLAEECERALAARFSCDLLRVAPYEDVADLDDGPPGCSVRAGRGTVVVGVEVEKREGST